MTSQKRSELVWLEWAGSSRDAAHSCGPIDYVSWSSPRTGDFQQVNVDTASCKTLCIEAVLTLAHVLLSTQLPSFFLTFPQACCEKRKVSLHVRCLQSQLLEIFSDPCSLMYGET